MQNLISEGAPGFSLHNQRERDFLVYCTKCGSQIAEDAFFCTGCGNQIATTPAGDPETSFSLTSSSKQLFDLDYYVMKKKEFSLKQHYEFEDGDRRKVAEAEAGIIAKLPTRFSLYQWTSSGTRGSELLRIESKVLSLRHECTIFDSGGQALASVKRTIQVNPFGSSLHSFYVEDAMSGQKIMEADGPAPLGNYKLLYAGKPAVDVQRRRIGSIFGAPEDFRYPAEVGIAILPGTDLDRRIAAGAVLVIDFIGRLDGEKGVGTYVSRKTQEAPGQSRLPGRWGTFATEQMERARKMQEMMPPEKRVRAITCPNCGAWNPRMKQRNNSVFCINCTQPLPVPENEMLSCPKCNGDVPAEAAKCPSCGKKF